MIRLAAAALDLADRGFAVFPCRPGTNKPAVAGWPDRATTDQATVERWWRRWPDANIGHCTGRTGVVVIDLDRDGDKDGVASWRDLQRRHGPVPDTLAVVSPREQGGVHLYFTAPPFYVKSTGSVLGPGVDVRGSRGQAVLPPSRRPEGPYRWANPGTPIARMPRWLVALLRPPPPPAPVQAVRRRAGTHAERYAVAALEGRAQDLAATTAGRHSALLAAARYLGGFVTDGHLTADDVIQTLEAAVLSTGYGNKVRASEIRRTITDGLAYARQDVA